MTADRPYCRHRRRPDADRQAVVLTTETKMSLSAGGAGHHDWPTDRPTVSSIRELHLDFAWCLNC
jgi:hypothetical protein